MSNGRSALVILVVSTLALAGAVSAHASFNGLTGLNRVVNARPAGNGMLSIGLFSSLGFSKDERPAELTPGTMTMVEDSELSARGSWAWATASGITSSSASACPTSGTGSPGTWTAPGATS